ncbi:MAG: hypothetical protein JXA98_02815, partial [Methanosarcinaceae archaeon]|nr:hypothetical protein [Methanosarcinaceae archaeon]
VEDGEISEYDDLSDGRKIELTHTMLKRTSHINFVDSYIIGYSIAVKFLTMKGQCYLGVYA